MNCAKREFSINPNIAINRDWLTAGFARFQLARYLKRWTEIRKVEDALEEP